MVELMADYLAAWMVVKMDLMMVEHSVALSDCHWVVPMVAYLAGQWAGS